MHSLFVHLQPKFLPEVLNTVIIITLERPPFGVLFPVTIKLFDSSRCKVADTTLETLFSLVAPLVYLQGVGVAEDFSTHPALVEPTTSVQLCDVLAQVVLPAQDRGTVGALQILYQNVSSFFKYRPFVVDNITAKIHSIPTLKTGLSPVCFFRCQAMLPCCVNLND